MTVTLPPLASVEDFESITGQRPTEVTEANLDIASGLVRDWCGWQVSFLEDDAVEVDADGSRLLLLPTLHIVAFTSLTYDDTLVPVGQYRWQRNGVVDLGEWRWHRGPFSRGGRYLAHLDHGYDPVPRTVVAEVVNIAGQLQANPTGASAVRVGDVSVTYGSAVNRRSIAASADGTTLTTTNLLARYRLPYRP